MKKLLLLLLIAIPCLAFDIATDIPFPIVEKPKQAEDNYNKQKDDKDYKYLHEIIVSAILVDSAKGLPYTYVCVQPYSNRVVSKITSELTALGYCVFKTDTRESGSFLEIYWDITVAKIEGCVEIKP